MTSRERVRSRSRIRTRTLVLIVVGSLALASLGALIIPLYTYPGVSWSAIISAKEANPSVPMVVIINPDNGPGASKDQNYVTGINNLRAAGVVVLGYDHTSWAGRPLATVEADINSYKSWYNVSGIFFDEMSNVPGNEGYYSTLNKYADSLGLNFTVGNPGGPAPASYLGTLDVIVTYENQGVPNSTYLASMTKGVPANHFAVIAYGVNVWNASAVSDVYNYASYVYVTNDTLPNPYGALSGDFSNMVSFLSNPLPSSVPLTVKSVDASGIPIAGVYTVITSANGTTVASGDTPLTVSVSKGAGYLVSVANYGSFVFEHWDDGSTSATQGVTVTGGTTVTATYGSQAPTTASMTIQSFALDDASIAGLSTTVTSNGNRVASGVTPLTFTGTIGESYTVSIGNSSSYVFDDWSGGNTSQAQTVTLAQNMTLSAYFTMAAQSTSTSSTSTTTSSSTSSTSSSSSTTSSATSSSSTTSTSSSTASSTSSTESASSSTTSSTTSSRTSAANASSTTTTAASSTSSSTTAPPSSTHATGSLTNSTSPSSSASATRLPTLPASTILLGIGLVVVVAVVVAGGTVLMRKKG
jgi:Spherulation-specific family 4